MGEIAEELVRISEELPPQKADQLLDFARFLKQQAQVDAAEGEGDAAWEGIIKDARPRPKLAAFVKEALAEGEAEPLDLKRL